MMRRRLVIFLVCLAALIWLRNGLLWEERTESGRFDQTRRFRGPPPPVMEIFDESDQPEGESTLVAAAPTLEALDHGAESEDPAFMTLAADEDLFTSTKVPRIRIEITAEGMEALGGRRHWRNRHTRPTVGAIVREGDRVYTNVAVHLKGAAGSFRSVDDRPCLTLNFDKYAPGQEFHGLRKLSLNNSVQDRSYLSEKICRELFHAAGVPVPRAAHALVKLNDRVLGLYVLTEGYNKQFLKRYFNNTKGNLYDGGFCQDIDAPLKVNSGNNPNDHPGLQALREVVYNPDSAQLMARLEQVLDVDRFLSFLAMDIIQCDWDGYPMHHNNWRLFHDLESNRMVFMPHGLDQMFGVQRTTPECLILPGMEGIVAWRFLELEEGRRRYLERLADLYTRVFKVETLLRRVDEIVAYIRPVLVATYGESFTQRYDYTVDKFKQRLVRRDGSLRQQLAPMLMRAQKSNVDE